MSLYPRAGTRRLGWAAHAGDRTSFLHADGRTRPGGPCDAAAGGVKTLFIVWHSRTGGARQMAQAAARAAATEPEIIVRLQAATDTVPEDLLAADGLIFVAPENLASLSGPMKDLLDRCFYPCLDRLNGRPYAAMICAGSDGAGAATQLARIATGWRLRRIAEPLIANVSAQSPEAILAEKRLSELQLQPCAELGATMASGMALGVF